MKLASSSIPSKRAKSKTVRIAAVAESVREAPSTVNSPPFSTIEHFGDIIKMNFA